MSQSFSGDFTLWKFLKNVPPRDLERVLGFHSGRLSRGFTVVVLAKTEIVTERDLELGASTRWSGSVLWDRSGNPRAIQAILQDRGQDVDELKRKVCAFFRAALDNVPAKVIPVLQHIKGMHYPDAEALGPGERSGVPTFKLTASKRFDTVRTYGQNYLQLPE